MMLLPELSYINQAVTAGMIKGIVTQAIENEEQVVTRLY